MDTDGLELDEPFFGLEANTDGALRDGFCGGRGQLLVTDVFDLLDSLVLHHL